MIEIKKIDVISMAKILGAVYVVMGFAIGIIFTLFSFAGISITEGEEGLITILFGSGAVIALPIFYGLMGFAIGLGGAWTYNVLAKKIGGIKFENEDN